MPVEATFSLVLSLSESLQVHIAGAAVVVNSVIGQMLPAFFERWS